MSEAKLAQVEAELVAAEQAFDEREREHERALAEVAADVALGALSAGDATIATCSSEEVLAIARERADSLRRALPELQARLERQRAEEAERERQAHARQVERACQDANAAAAKLAKVLAEADAAARDLMEKRGAVDSVIKTAGARPDDLKLRHDCPLTADRSRS